MEHEEGKKITLHFDPKTVKSISPSSVEIEAAVQIVSACDEHKDHQGRCWVLISALGYTDIADVVMIEGLTARITGKGKEEWKKAMLKAKPGDNIRFAGQKCGCNAIKLTGEEIAAICQGKVFACEYNSLHLVDER